MLFQPRSEILRVGNFPKISPRSRTKALKSIEHVTSRVPTAPEVVEIPVRHEKTEEERKNWKMKRSKNASRSKSNIGEVKNWVQRSFSYTMYNASIQCAITKFCVFFLEISPEIFDVITRPRSAQKTTRSQSTSGGEECCFLRENASAINKLRNRRVRLCCYHVLDRFKVI